MLTRLYVFDYHRSLIPAGIAQRVKGAVSRLLTASKPFTVLESIASFPDIPFMSQSRKHSPNGKAGTVSLLRAAIPARVTSLEEA